MSFIIILTFGCDKTKEESYNYRSRPKLSIKKKISFLLLVLNNFIIFAPSKQ